MPICVICSDPLCRINEISLSEEEVAVWVKCGHCFHLRCINKLVRNALDSSPLCQAKCPYCSSPPSTTSQCGNPKCTCQYYRRIYLPTEKPEPQAVLPLDIMVKGKIQSRLNILAIAQYAGIEADELIKKLEKDRAIWKKDSEEYWRMSGKSVVNMQQYIAQQVKKCQVEVTAHRESYVYKMLENLNDSISPLVKAITEASKSSRLKLDLDDSIKALLEHHNDILHTLELRRSELLEMQKDKKKYMLVVDHAAARKNDTDQIDKLNEENKLLKGKLKSQEVRLACIRIERDVARSLNANLTMERKRRRISQASEGHGLDFEPTAGRLEDQAKAVPKPDRYASTAADTSFWVLSGRLRMRTLIPRTRPLYPVSATIGLGSSPCKLFNFGATTLPGIKSLTPEARSIMPRQARNEDESDAESQCSAVGKRLQTKSRRSLQQRGLRAVRALPRRTTTKARS